MDKKYGGHVHFFWDMAQKRNTGAHILMEKMGKGENFYKLKYLVIQLLTVLLQHSYTYDNNLLQYGAWLQQCAYMFFY